MIIPDLDEQAEEDITLQVAEAPRNRTIKLPTLAELNADLAAHSIIPVKPGEKRLDLSLLNNRLVPPAMVKENTEDWTWDGLLRDVARDFQEEAERNVIMKEKKARSRRPAGLRCLHAIDATRVHLTSMRVVAFSSLRLFGPRRCSAQVQRD